MNFINNLTAIFTPANFAAVPKVSFRSSELPAFQNEAIPQSDKFSTNPLYSSLGSKAEIEQLAKSNPRIMALLSEYNIPLKVNVDVLEDMR